MWIFITIVAVVAVLVVVGYLMPVRYEGKTVAQFDRSVQAVWDALQDVESHPMTGKMMKIIEILPAEEGRPAWTEDMGRGELITVKTSVFDPPHRLVREMSSASVNMNSRWDYTLGPSGDGCRVNLSGVTDIEAGTWHTPVFRIMMFVGGGVKKGLDIQLEMVAATLEAEKKSNVQA